MMLTWMLSALVFALCIALVAASAEPFARAMRLPTRWIWAVALAVATLWPVVSTIALLLMPSLRETATKLSSIRIVPDRAVLGVDAPGDGMQLVSRVAIVLWALASLLLCVRLVRALVVLRRMRRAAEHRVVDGVEVLVSDDLGPATIGLRRHAVVVPRTVLALEEPLRRLVLRHESEHRVARDPWLLLAASVAVVLFPWNAALWSIARRLRLALEIDCDERVLAGGGDPVRYGRLLLLFAQRHRAVPLALTLATPPSLLERRIIAMRSRLARPRPLQLVAAGAVLVLGIAGACSAGAPDAPATRQAAASQRPAAQRSVSIPPATSQSDAGAKQIPGVRREAAAQRATAERQVSTPATTSRDDVGAKQISGVGVLRYPDEMRAANREGEVYTMFVVDERGLVDTSSFRVVKSTDPAFTAAVRAALPTMRFTPARKAGRAVRQVVEQPFTFALARN